MYKSEPLRSFTELKLSLSIWEITNDSFYHYRHPLYRLRYLKKKHIYIKNIKTSNKYSLHTTIPIAIHYSFALNNNHFHSQYQLVDWKLFLVKNLLSFISVSYLLFIFINKFSRPWTRKKNPPPMSTPLFTAVLNIQIRILFFSL